MESTHKANNNHNLQKHIADLKAKQSKKDLKSLFVWIFSDGLEKKFLFT